MGGAFAIALAFARLAAMAAATLLFFGCTGAATDRVASREGSGHAFSTALRAWLSKASRMTAPLSGHTDSNDQKAMRAFSRQDGFASLTLFQLLRMPLMFLPLSFSAIADAQNAIGRLYAVFDAETLTDTKVQDASMDAAIRVEHGDFTWDAPPPEVAAKKKVYTPFPPAQLPRKVCR